MINFFKRILMAGLIAGFSIGGLFAQGAYMGYGLGLQVDLGNLGGTITKDGLDNRNGTQKIIIPENTIDVFHRSGLVTKETKGAMTGLLLSAFYEKDSTNTFWRIGAEYTKKILGGKTKAQIVGYTLIDQNWDFYSFVVPFYFGLKANLGETSSVYGGLGLNYFKGGWSLRGTVDGATPCYISFSLAQSTALCGLGPSGIGLIDPVSGSAAQIITTLSEPERLLSGAIFGEEIIFDVSGIGFNFMLGIDAKMQGGNKLYFEIEYLLDAKMDNAPVRAIGTINQLAPTGNISYPIVIGGVRYKFGYKMPAAF